MDNVLGMEVTEKKRVWGVMMLKSLEIEKSIWSGANPVLTNLVSLTSFQIWALRTVGANSVT